MYFFGRGISAFFNQLFRWLFWNKKGNKVLFTILFFIIAICFIKLGEVSAVEEVSDVNYEVLSYYDGVVNDFILRLDMAWDSIPSNYRDAISSNSGLIYVYYGNVDGSSYNNAKPINNGFIRCAIFARSNLTSNGTIQNYDYMGVTGKTMYLKTPVYKFSLQPNGTFSTHSANDTYLPEFVFTYYNQYLSEYLVAKNSGNTERVVELLEEINESLSNTTPDQETEDSVVVDSSAVDSISTASVDNVFSSLFTTLGNKFNNYDLSVTESWVWNLMGTRITFYSDTIYKVIKGTFMETLITSLWLYITGHYAFAWLSKLIHSIKDGSILNGIEMNEVLTKEIL